MSLTKPAQNNSGVSARWFALFFVLLVVLLSLFFRQSFSHNKVLYSNDGPLGLANASANRLPSGFFGLWWDLNWLGNEGISASPSVSGLIGTLLGPLYFAKFYCALAILIVGVGAWFCFRRLKLAPAACFIGGLAAALNSDFFSTSCWGVCSTVIGIAMSYFALGFLADNTGRKRWVGAVLGGLAVGMGVMEAFDIGALFSLFIATFVVFQALFLNEGAPAARRVGTGAIRLVLVGVFAAFIAVHALSALVGTQISNVAGMAQDAATKAMRWQQVTLYSEPKEELLSVAIPGLFGYRTDWYMYDNDQPQEDKYWGGLPDPVGTGNYVGIAVVVMAIWAGLQSFRKKGSPFTLLQRRAIWFWGAMLAVAALLAFGRYAPVFQLFYALPYVSTIRSPVKFMHVFSWILEILFAYGIHGLYVAYLQGPEITGAGCMARFKTWWRAGAAYDRRWLVLCIGIIVASLLGWLIYASSAPGVTAYIQQRGNPPELAAAMAKFSQQAVGWYVFFLVLTVAWLALTFSGQFAGTRMTFGLALLGLLLFVDLGRSDRPWISYWDTDYKYRPDPVVNFLLDKPYERRVSAVPSDYYQYLFSHVPQAKPTPALAQQFPILYAAYQGDWKQHLFWYDDIECVDVAQEPRIGTDKIDFMSALHVPVFQGQGVAEPRGLLRLWELSGTRYVFGLGGNYVALLNQLVDPKEQRLRIAKLPDGRSATFDFAPKRPDAGQYPVDYGTVLKPDGQLAVLEFTGALPRASLFTNWQVETNDSTTLQTIASPAFNPHEKVLVSDPLPAPTPAADSNQPAGKVEITSYAPKRIELKTDAKTPSVLLLTDRYNPKWEVTVDGKPDKVLRCDFIERGVFLQPGPHTVVFSFDPSVRTFWISLAAVLLGLVLCAWFVFGGEGGAALPESGAKPKAN